MRLLVIINFLIALVHCKDGFDSNCLDSHNEYRKKHGSPPMKWSESLANAAQKWADQLAKEDRFDHDLNTINSKNQGENLAYFSPPKKKCMGAKTPDCVQCSEMVTDWYNEVKDYDFNTGKAKIKGKVVLHFTQVVWKASLELGVGVGIGKKYGFITVARYSPRGNMGGPEDFKKNVLPAGSSTGPGTMPPTTPSTSSPSGSTGSVPSNGPGTMQPTTPSTSPPSGSTGSVPSTGSGTTPPSTPSKSSPSGSAGGASTPPGTTFTSSTTTTTTPSPVAKTTTKKQGSENCEYFIITTITKQQKIVQKCKGKPNVTFVPSSAVVGTPQPPKPQSTNKPPTTISSSPQANAASNQPTSGAPNTTPGGPTGQPSTKSQPATNPTGGSIGPASSPTSNSSVNKNQHDKSIMLVNLYRVMHGAAPLFWNKDLQKDAQAWAEKIARTGKLEHDNSMKDGENLAKLSASNRDVMNAIDAWYDEEKLYDYKNPKFDKATGHFTQVVWKESQEMGLGIAPSKDNSQYYIVARFRPSGNIQGKFAANVGPKVSI